jgi:hypothetical protein
VKIESIISDNFWLQTLDLTSVLAGLPRKGEVGDGQITSCFQKYVKCLGEEKCSSVFQKYMIISAHPASMTRDVSTDRHEPWGGDAMDADATSDERGGRGRRNRVVLISRRWDQALY